MKKIKVLGIILLGLGIVLTVIGYKSFKGYKDALRQANDLNLVGPIAYDYAKSVGLKRFYLLIGIPLILTGFLNIKRGKTTNQKEENVMAERQGSLGLCPFSWIQQTEAPGCLAGFFGAKAKPVWKPVECMRSACQLWDNSQGNCGLITKK